MDYENSMFNAIDDQPDIDPDDFQRIHPSLNSTVNDAMLIIYAFSIRHNLNWNAVEDLVRVVNSIVGTNVLSSTKYAFKKNFGNKEGIKRTVHFYCNFCGMYSGTQDNLKATNDKLCRNCQNEICIDIKYKKNHFFTIPIKTQIEKLLDQNSAHISFDSQLSTNFICDVYHSKNYRRLKGQMGEDPFITLTVNTDGASIFKSTKEKSFWPIQFIINEIDIAHRFKRRNILCSAFSFGKSPDMQMFFRSFIAEVNQINMEGGIPFRMKNGQMCKLKVSHSFSQLMLPLKVIF